MLAIEKFRDMGVTQIRLETATANDAARGLFTSCGFRPSTVGNVAGNSMSFHCTAEDAERRRYFKILVFFLRWRRTETDMHTPPRFLRFCGE